MIDGELLVSLWACCLGNLPPLPLMWFTCSRSWPHPGPPWEGAHLPARDHREDGDSRCAGRCQLRGGFHFHFVRKSTMSSVVWVEVRGRAPGQGPHCWEVRDLGAWGI